MSGTQRPNAYALSLADAIARGVQKACVDAGLGTAASGARPDFRTPPYTREETTLLVMKLFRAHVSPMAKRIAELERRLAILESQKSPQEIER